MIRCRINQTERLITYRFSGNISLADWESKIKRTMGEYPDFATFDTLTDVRNMNSIVTSQEVMDLMRMVREAGLAGLERKAVVLTERAVHFGMSRMFESFSEGESKVRRLTTSSISDAAAWLNKPETLVRAELDALSDEMPDKASDGNAVGGV